MIVKYYGKIRNFGSTEYTKFFMALVQEQLSYQVLGALFDVMNEIGYGHKEHIYQKAIPIALSNRNIPYKEQVRVKIVMMGEHVGSGYIDFLIDERLVLEIKSSYSFRSADFQQIQRYLKTLKLQLGILAAFSPTGVRYRRVLNTY